MKDLSRLLIHILVQDGKFDTLDIDSVKFIILNGKTIILRIKNWLQKYS
jgi:hypothetical protein